MLGDRHPPSDAEGAAGDFDPGCGLGAFVFVEVDPSLDPAHRLFIETAGDNVTPTLVFLDVELEDLIEHIVGWERILIDLGGLSIVEGGMIWCSRLIQRAS